MKHWQNLLHPTVYLLNDSRSIRHGATVSAMNVQMIWATGLWGPPTQNGKFPLFCQKTCRSLFKDKICICLCPTPSSLKKMFIKTSDLLYSYILSTFLASDRVNKGTVKCGLTKSRKPEQTVNLYKYLVLLNVWSAKFADSDELRWKIYSDTRSPRQYCCCGSMANRR